MQRLDQLDMTDHRIWKDKKIPTETKYIYTYIRAKGIDKVIVNLNIGEIQQVVKIKNKGLKKNLELLERLKYLVYHEYSNGMYTVTIN